MLYHKKLRKFINSSRLLKLNRNEKLSIVTPVSVNCPDERSHEGHEHFLAVTLEFRVPSERDSVASNRVENIDQDRVHSDEVAGRSVPPVSHV